MLPVGKKFICLEVLEDHVVVTRIASESYPCPMVAQAAEGEGRDGRGGGGRA